MKNSNEHHVRNLVLPSGRVIQVVRFDEGPARSAPALHICPECESDLVQPVSWSEAGPGQWELTLRCPNCDWIAEGVYDQEACERLENKFDEGVETVLADLMRLAHANMEDDIARFVEALQADLILPEDF